jgi:hypothetical protein
MILARNGASDLAVQQIAQEHTGLSFHSLICNNKNRLSCADMPISLKISPNSSLGQLDSTQPSTALEWSSE